MWQAPAALSIADHLGGLEGALAAVLLVHEARVGRVGQRLYISQVYVLLVVAARDSVVAGVVTLLVGSFGLLGLYKLFGIIY